MKLKHNCPLCNATGRWVTTDPCVPPVEIPCPSCDGKGYTTEEINFPEYDVLLEKLGEIKTKQNQMQADINYIKAKVG